MIARAFFALAALAMIAGCGDVTVTGTLGDRALNVGGTAFGWIDGTQFIADAQGSPVLQTRPTDQTHLRLFFSEAVFDPSVDFRTLPSSERAGILDDIARGDLLHVDIARGNVIRSGDQNIELVPPGALPPEVLPFIDLADIALGVDEVTASDRYPDRAPRAGSNRTVRLTVSQTSPELVAKLAVSVKNAPAEHDGFSEGDITVSFGISLLPERLAECNFDSGGEGVVDPCTLQDLK
jgi:hypothetical protein